MDFHIQTLENCPDVETRRETLVSAAYQLDEDGLLALESVARSLFDATDLQPQIARLNDMALSRRFDRPDDGGDWRTAAAIALDRKDRGQMIKAGWALLDIDAVLAHQLFDAALQMKADPQSRYGRALAAFNHDDLRFALAYRPETQTEDAMSDYAQDWLQLAALAHLRDGENARAAGKPQDAVNAAQIARSINPDYAEQADRLTGGALLDAAQKAYDKADYGTSRVLARQAAGYAPTWREGEMRAAWAGLQLGDSEQSQAAFRRMYDLAPDDQTAAQAAEGLMLAAWARGGLDELGPLARDGAGALREADDQQQSDAPLARRDYSAAYKLSPRRHRNLRNASAPYVRQSVAWRATNGKEGVNRVEGAITRTSFGVAKDGLRIEAGVAALSLRAGEAAAEADVGVPGEANPDAKVRAASPFFKFASEGAVAVSGKLGSTPIGGPVGLLPVGEFAVERRGRHMTIKAGVNVRSRADSLTSLMGRKIRAGQKWGRVAESGVELSDEHALHNRMTLRSRINGAVIEGEHVVDNSKIAAETGLAIDVKPAENTAFDYIVTGPFYQFSAYETNSNFHTLGHGGYFSPQVQNRFGWSLNVQTRDQNDWMARVDAAAVFEETRTDPSPVLPLDDPDGPQFAGTKDSGMAAALRVEAGRRVSKNWIATAAFTHVNADSFEESQIGLGLRYTVKPRAKLLSRDFEPDIFNRDIW